MTRDDLLRLIDQAAAEDWQILRLRQELTELPPEIGQLTSLQTLHLVYNQLSRLPPEIGQLTNLKSLSLGSNQLSRLPPEIGQLTSLKSLDLFGNQLSHLPTAIRQLIKLEELDLQGNPIPLPHKFKAVCQSTSNIDEVKEILDFYFQTLDLNKS
ncbi:MAG: leucine-rich repeat domain-containing protein [Cyanobacteria bacterium P01_E01_bin.43]